MTIYTICVIISSISFLFYGISYFTGTHMKTEFKRFRLEKFALTTVIFEILGALGLVVGYYFNKELILISSAGLTILMLLGLIVRLRLKDSFLITLPALFFMGLNAYIFYFTITYIA